MNSTASSPKAGLLILGAGIDHGFKAGEDESFQQLKRYTEERYGTIVLRIIRWLAGLSLHRRTWRRLGAAAPLGFFKWTYSGKTQVIFGQKHLIFGQERNNIRAKPLLLLLFFCFPNARYMYYTNIVILWFICGHRGSFFCTQSKKVHGDSSWRNSGGMLRLLA